MPEETASARCVYGQPVPFEPERPLSFPDFQLIYSGRSSPDEPGGPTVSIVRDHFTIVGPDGEATPLVIVSGQLPPRPAEFEVNGRKFELTTHSLPKGGRLPPRHLAVFAGRENGWARVFRRQRG